MVIVERAAIVRLADGEVVVEHAMRRPAVAIDDRERDDLVERVAGLRVEAARIDGVELEATAGAVVGPGLVAEPVVAFLRPPRHVVRERAAAARQPVGLRRPVLREGLGLSRQVPGDTERRQPHHGDKARRRDRHGAVRLRHREIRAGEPVEAVAAAAFERRLEATGRDRPGAVQPPSLGPQQRHADQRIVQHAEHQAGAVLGLEGDAGPVAAGEMGEGDGFHAQAPWRRAGQCAKAGSAGSIGSDTGAPPAAALL